MGEFLLDLFLECILEALGQIIKFPELRKRKKVKSYALIHSGRKIPKSKHWH